MAKIIRRAIRIGAIDEFITPPGHLFFSQNRQIWAVEIDHLDFEGGLSFNRSSVSQVKDINIKTNSTRRQKSMFQVLLLIRYFFRSIKLYLYTRSPRSINKDGDLTKTMFRRAIVESFLCGPRRFLRSLSTPTKRRRSVVVSTMYYEVPSACMLDFYRLVMRWRKSHAIRISKSTCR